MGSSKQDRTVSPLKWFHELKRRLMTYEVVGTGGGDVGLKTSGRSRERPELILALGNRSQVTLEIV